MGRRQRTDHPLQQLPVQHTPYQRSDFVDAGVHFSDDSEEFTLPLGPFRWCNLPSILHREIWVFAEPWPLVMRLRSVCRLWRSSIDASPPNAPSAEVAYKLGRRQENNSIENEIMRSENLARAMRDRIDRERLHQQARKYSERKQREKEWMDQEKEEHREKRQCRQAPSEQKSRKKQLPNRFLTNLVVVNTESQPTYRQNNNDRTPLACKHRFWRNTHFPCEKELLRQPRGRFLWDKVVPLIEHHTAPTPLGKRHRFYLTSG